MASAVALQTLHLAHLPPDLAVHVALYTELQNATFLREQLLAGNAEFEYAFIDASVVRSFFSPGPLFFFVSLRARNNFFFFFFAGVGVDDFSFEYVGWVFLN